MDITTAVATLAKLPVTIELKQLGLTDEQMARTSFSQKYRDRPIEEWVLTWDPTVDLIQNPKLPSPLRLFAIYKYAMIDGPIDNCPHVSQAFRAISEEAIGKLVAARLAYLGRQKAHAEKPRKIIPEIGIRIKEFICDYANRGDNRLLRPQELWDGFGSELNSARLDSTLVGASYSYGIDQKISYKTFRKYVLKARKMLLT